MIPVLQKGEPVLRKVAKPVKKSDIGSPKLTVIIKKMRKVIAEQEDAVAVAAPQIGEQLRLFVVSGKVLLPDYAELSDEEMAALEKAGDIPPDLVFINPEITKLSREKQVILEGCLSVRWLYGNVRRSLKATVKAWDEHGQPFTRGASGLLAQIFQHEVDHLNGILFVDSATELREEQPPEVEKTVQKNKTVSV
jgi:peptide deformylase